MASGVQIIQNALLKISGMQNKIDRLNKEIDDLSWDASFQMYNSAGLKRKISKLTPGHKYGIAFLDLDCLHELNTVYGYDDVNVRISKTFDWETNNGIVIGRVFSGDEILIMAKGGLDPLKQVLSKIRLRGMEEQISFMAIVRSWMSGSGDLETYIKQMGRQLLKLKERRTKMGNSVKIAV